ncbi:MAG: PEGA domain-containing protein [Candidatus Neomarinimicrobiota bacterium]
MRRVLSIAAIGILLLAGSLPAQEKQTLAVLEFEGFGLSESEVQALTNRLRTNTTQLGVYRVIERGLMLQILQKQDFQLTGCTSNECAVEIGQLLGAQLVLAGSIGKVGNTWTVEMRIVDVESRAVIETASYGTQGSIDLVLTEGMSAAARKICRVTTPEVTTGPTLRPAIVDVMSDPPGAILFVNDLDKGPTPVTQLELNPGAAHTVTVRLDRYHALDTTLILEVGERSQLNLQLKPIMGWLALNGDAGSHVRLDGKIAGKTPMDRIPLQMGSYQLRITKPEYYSYKDTATILSDHETALNYTLKRKPKGPAVALSVVMPGGGQLYHGYRKGVIYLGAAMGIGYWGYTTHRDFLDHYDTYQERLDDYNRETNVEIALEKMEAVQESFDSMKQAEKGRNIYLSMLGGVWIINIVDIAF